MPGVYVAQRNNCLLKQSVWGHCWCHPGLVLPPVCLPLSPLFPPNGLPVGVLNARCLLVQIRKFAIYSRFRYLQKLDDTMVHPVGGKCW